MYLSLLCACNNQRNFELFFIEFDTGEIQDVRMKGIQNKKLYLGNCHTSIRFMSSERKTLKVFFFSCPAYAHAPAGELR
jgi:hypothetical protein